MCCLNVKIISTFCILFYILTEGRVQPVENRGKIFGISKTLFISLVALFGVLAVAISVGALVTSSGPSKRDCKGDTFEVVKYNYSDAPSGQHGERFLKYKFVEDEKYDDFYEFTKAKVLVASTMLDFF